MTVKAQERYETKLVTRQLPDGRTVYTSAIPRSVKVDEQDIVIVADQNDRADIIANNVYRTPVDWWKIASANGKVDGSLYFTPGQDITIPRKI